MKSAEIKTIGQHRGSPRVWLEGNQPLNAGFAPGSKYSISKIEDKNMVALIVTNEGTRVVSKKEKSGKEIPVIDINSTEILSMFEGMKAVRVIMQKNAIYILPLATEVRKKERIDRLKKELASNVVTMGSISHGGGVLSHAIHEGFSQAGIKTKLMFANDIDPDILEHAQETNDVWTEDTQFINLPMQELAFDEYVSSHLSKVSVLELGIPCAAHSVAGRAKKNQYNHPEDDPIYGHLVVGFLAIVAKINPAVIALENVPQYLNSASMGIIKNQLNDMGYNVETTILRSAEWNSLEHRERMCMIAATEGIEFDFTHLERPEKAVRKLGEIMDSIPLDDPTWSEMLYLKEKQVRDSEKGNSFAMQIFDEQSEKISTLRKGYHKNGSSDPKIQHPENKNLLRLLNQFEHARCKGIPEKLIKGLSKTAAHEILGQSIVYDPFVSVGKMIGSTIEKKLNLKAA